MQRGKKSARKNKKCAFLGQLLRDVRNAHFAKFSIYSAIVLPLIFFVSVGAYDFEKRPVILVQNVGCFWRPNMGELNFATG